MISKATKQQILDLWIIHRINWVWNEHCNIQDTFCTRNTVQIPGFRHTCSFMNYNNTYTLLSTVQTYIMFFHELYYKLSCLESKTSIFIYFFRLQILKYLQSCCWSQNLLYSYNTRTVVCKKCKYWIMFPEGFNSS